MPSAALLGLSPASPPRWPSRQACWSPAVCTRTGCPTSADGFGGGQHAREKAGDHARQPHRHLWRLRTGAVDPARWSALAELGSPSHGPVRPRRRPCRLARALAAFMQMLPQARVDGLSAGVGTLSDSVVLTRPRHRRARPFAARPERRRRRRHLPGAAVFRISRNSASPRSAARAATPSARCSNWPRSRFSSPHPPSSLDSFSETSQP